MHFWCTFGFSQNLLTSRKLGKLRKFFPFSKFTKLVNGDSGNQQVMEMMDWTASLSETPGMTMTWRSPTATLWTKVENLRTTCPQIMGHFNWSMRTSRTSRSWIGSGKLRWISVGAALQRAWGGTLCGEAAGVASTTPSERGHVEWDQRFDELAEIDTAWWSGSSNFRTRAMTYLLGRRRYLFWSSLGRVDPNEEQEESVLPDELAAVRYGWGYTTDEPGEEDSWGDTSEEVEV